MKAINYISILAILALGSCTSSIYTGLEYDDLYYSHSDQPMTRVKRSVVNQAPESNLQAKDYYDNIMLLIPSYLMNILRLRQTTMLHQTRISITIILIPTPVG